MNLRQRWKKYAMNIVILQTHNSLDSTLQKAANEQFLFYKARTDYIHKFSNFTRPHFFVTQLDCL